MVIEKTNVLFVLIELSTGGTERVVLDLASNLDKSSFNVYVAFFFDGPLREVFRQVTSRLFQIPKKEGFDPAAMWHISRIVRKQRIDVINAHHYMPFFYSFFGSRGLRKRAVIYTEHSVSGVEAIRSSMHERLCNLILYDTDAVVGVSTEIGRFLEESFPAHRGKILCIPNSVDVARFTAHYKNNRVRSELGLLPEHFVIGNVANFRNVKNHCCLIRAFHRISLRYPNVRLVLVGKGYPDEADNSEYAMRNLIREYNLEDRVIFTGDRQDIPEILGGIDAFCLPSFSEGLPVSILEAMSARVPVIGSNVRGIREVISSGETGLLFSSDDDNHLSQLIEKLIEDVNLRQDLSRKAYTYVSESHGMEKWISTYEHLFKTNNPHIKEKSNWMYNEISRKRYH